MMARQILVRCLSEKQAAVRLVSCHARPGYGLSNAVGPGPIPALGAARHAAACAHALAPKLARERAAAKARVYEACWPRAELPKSSRPASELVIRGALELHDMSPLRPRQRVHASSRCRKEAVRELVR